MAATNGKLPLPLEGVRVLDATHIVAGPFCSLILADMGAEVIKIERPGTGDRARTHDPFIEKPDGRRISSRFLAVNRNKKSVTIDLRDPLCRQAFHKLLKASDVLLDNWGPGAMRRLGLGYDQLRKINPGLVYASITGYGDSDGLKGPYSNWPANNPCVQGMGGWMEVTGPPEAPPQMVGDNIGDSLPGVWTALGIVLALETRRKTGLGQHVDMAMYDCMVAHMTQSVPFYQATGKLSDRSRENMIYPQLTLRCKDGYAVLAGGGQYEKWVNLWKFIGREDLLQDPRYLRQGITGEFYFSHIVPAMEEWSQHLSKWEVTEKLIKLGFSMGVVQNQADVDRCPHLKARNMFVDSGDALGGSFRTINTPVQLTGCVASPNTRPPHLGEHNEEVLCSIGGLTKEELGQLRADGKV